MLNQEMKLTGLEKLRPATVFKRIALIGVVCTAFFTSLPIFAKDNEAQAKKTGVSVELTQFKVIKAADGKEQLVEDAIVKPGDVMEYRATYVNHSGGAITGLVGDLPIPEGLEYVRKSARPGAAVVKVATKEGAFASEPLMRKVGAVQQEVPANEYRRLRWALGRLAAEGKTTVSARALVQTYAAPTVVDLAAASQAPPALAARVSATPKP